MDIRRFGAQYRSPAYTHARIKETYETYYDIRYPNHERQAGRPLRISPANAWHREHGAAFGEKSGWERVNWYESNAAAGDEALRPRGWAGQHWSPAIGAEHRATREAVALFDESSFAKLEIEGVGAETFLEVLCDNRVAREVGQITYTQMLNGRGGIECDFTVARLDEERFSIVTGTAFGNHDREWMRRHLPDGDEVRIHDVTSQWACFGIWGPRAREVLQPLTPQDLGNEAFPYMTLRETTLGNVPVRMLRVTYVGELGWEIYCPTEYGLGLWQALWEAGQPQGIVAGGYRAIDSLRLEKGYRVWGADITPDETPYEGGVGFCVKLDKPVGFVGEEAILDRAGRRAAHAPALPHPRRPALDRARQRAGPGRRRGRRPGDERRLRLHGRALDRLRLPAARARAGDRGRGRDLRPLGRGRGRKRAALRPQGRARPRLGAFAAYGRKAPRLRRRPAPAAGRRGCARCPRCARASAAPPAAPSPLRSALTSRACCSLERARTSGGWAISAIRSLICDCTSVIALSRRGDCAASAMSMWKRMSVRRYSSKFSTSPAIFATSSSSRSNCASLPRSAASRTAPDSIATR